MLAGKLLPIIFHGHETEPKLGSMVKACGNCGNELDIESIEINEEHFCASEGRKEELDKAGTEYLHHTADGGHILNNYISERS